LKKLEEMNKDVIDEQREYLSKVRYVEREEDLELKAMYEEEQKKFENLQETMADKIDGEIDMDMHGNFTFRSKGAKGEKGITESGTYVLRDGKLVPGKAEVRE
jgi:hypothetical protein